VKIKICDITNFERRADRLPQFDESGLAEFLNSRGHVIASRALDRKHLATFGDQNIDAPQIFLDERVRDRFLDDLRQVAECSESRE
jgi:hypothetical protein